LEAMDFIEEEYLLRFKRRENCRQVAFPLQQRSSAGLNRHIQLVSDNLRQRRLAEPWRAVEQHMIERFAATARSLHCDLNVLFHALLADVLVKALGADAGFDTRVFIVGSTGYDPLGLPRSHHAFCRGFRHFRFAEETLTQRTRRESGEEN